ncbi:MAG TPA: hypothetical protein VFX42_03415, partial [Gemmatimonadales bacterium]|nr:hypothetical protein [Gemmatimonadales bacterium]
MQRRVLLAALADMSRKTATKILVEYAERGLVGPGRINISKLSRVSSAEPGDVADRSSQWRTPADRVARRLAEHKVEVRTVRPVRRVAGESKFVAG